jgi:hypothetical protein
MTSERWRIAEDAEDWQCDWESAKRFQLRYFRSLPTIEKFRAVEEMCRLARILAKRRAGKREKPRS